MMAPPMPADAARYAADVVLRDGGSIHLRAIRPDDRARLVEHFHRLSAPSVYFRFFGGKRRLSDDEWGFATSYDRELVVECALLLMARLSR